MSDENTKYCVTLVHGTFAPNAPWTHEGSVLRNELRKNLDGTVEFSAPVWGGANSPSARRRAADQLADHLARQFEAHPDSRHFVIAHSHGGNIALMACCAEKVATKLSGIVCLATPFLRYRSRRFLPYLRLLVFSVFAFILFGLVLLIGWPDDNSKGPRPEDGTAESYADNGVKISTNAMSNFGESFMRFTEDEGPFRAILAVVAPLGASLWLSYLVARRFGRPIQKLQNECAERYRTPSELPFRTLNVYVGFDEPRLGLRGLRRFAEIPFRLNPIVLGIYALSGIVYPFILPGMMKLPSSAPVWVLCTALGLLMCAYMLGFISAVAQVAMLLFSISRGHKYGFGWDGLTPHWLGDITAEPKPSMPDTHYETRMIPVAPLRTEIGDKAPLWNHSLLYDSPDVIRGIAEWFTQQNAPKRV